VAEIIEKVANALAYAHGKGVVHRDIKPSNILVNYQNEPYLTDFGLAEQWGESVAGGAVGTTPMAGTPFFLAPEMYLEKAEVSPAVDIYALGVTLYKLLTGRYPFGGKSSKELRQNVLHGEPLLLQEIAPSIPEPLQRICLKAMEKIPEMRYPSAQAMADDLRRFREGREVFARPTRYETELRGKLQNHVTEIHLWREHHLIDVPEMDRLAHPYRQLMGTEFPWHDLARRFPWEAILLRLGGWLVIVGSVLWFFYWPRLDRPERILCVGIPTLVLSLVGWFFYHRRNPSTAFIFLSMGALLLPLFMGILLTEHHWARSPQLEDWEIFGKYGAISDSEIAEELSVETAREAAAAQAEGRPARSLIVPPTNMQLTVSMGVFVAYVLVLLSVTRVRAFVIWTGLGVYLLFSTVLLQYGLKEWVTSHHVARTLLCYIGLALSFLALAIGLEKYRRREWAEVSCVFFPVPFVILMTLLAGFGVDEWLEIGIILYRDYVEAFCLWLMANGVVYFGIFLLSVRAHASFIRLWGRFFALLVSVSLLVPLNWLCLKGYGIDELSMTIGPNPVSIYEPISFFVSAGLVALGTKLRRLSTAVSGLAGLAVILCLVTGRHFGDELSWPLGLAVSGGAVMFVALTLVVIRSRKQHHALS